MSGPRSRSPGVNSEVPGELGFPWCQESPRLCGHSFHVDCEDWSQPCLFGEGSGQLAEASPMDQGDMALAVDPSPRLLLPAPASSAVRKGSHWADRTPSRTRAGTTVAPSHAPHAAARYRAISTSSRTGFGDIEAPDADAAAGGPGHSSAAATLIQNRWRERLTLARVQVKEGIHEAALTIQSLWRHRRTGSALKSDRGRAYSEELRKLRSTVSAATTKNNLDQPLLHSDRSVNNSGHSFAQSFGKLVGGGATSPRSSALAHTEESLLMRKGKGLEKWLEEKKQQAMTQMIKAGVPTVEKWISDIGELIKANATYDPDMWPWVKIWLRNAIDGVWRDLSNEIRLNVDLTLDDNMCRHRLSTKSREQHKYEKYRCLIPYLRFRSFILWHYIPFDKTFFGKIKDPVYILLFVITLIPMPGVRVLFFAVIILMLLFPGPPDDFQLTNFILIFKGTQFFTTGVTGMFMGGMHYYICYIFHMDELLVCMDTNGPGNSDPIVLGLIDYFGSIVLVWVAFLFLPFSEKHALPGAPQVKKAKKEVICCGFHGIKNRGHRLKSLLRWDVGSFLFSVIAYTALYWMRPGHQGGQDLLHETLDLKSTIFWCRTTYALTSLPFALFMIPVIRNMLTNSVNSGFDKSGACVIYELPLTEEYLAAHGKA